MATKLLKASSDERELTAIKERLAQMSQRATFQILVCYVVLSRRNTCFYFPSMYLTVNITFKYTVIKLSRNTQKK